MQEREIIKFFQEAISNDDRFSQAVAVVTANCQGKFWLIGGGLFRKIVSRIYGSTQPPIKDYDFIIENPNSELVLPKGWQSSTNSFGNPKLISPDNLQVDFAYLSNLHQLRLRGLPPTIESYLTTTPLTVQSICFDFLEGRISGPIGIRAILTKTVEVNDLEWARWYAQKQNLTLEEYIKREADRLGFTPVFP